MGTARSRTDMPAGTIVVGIDGSPASTQALDWAGEQARLDKRRITLLHATGGAASLPAVWPGGMAYHQAEVIDALREGGRELLDEAGAHLSERFPEVPVTEVLSTSDPRAALVEASTHAAMVVVGAHDRGPVRSMLHSSIGVAVTRHAACPVVVVRTVEPVRRPRPVLVSVNGAPPARRRAGTRTG